MYAFTFRQIQVFLEICNVGNFSGAASRLDVSQPAISNVIRSLESQLGVELFERRRGASCVLTQEGMAFRDCSQQFVSHCDSISRSGSKRIQALRVFVGAHLLEDFLRPVLPEFYEDHPQLQMNFLPDKNRDRILQDIAEDKVDVAVITVPPDERAQGSTLIGTVAAGIYGTRGVREASAQELSSLPFILPAADDALTASILRQLALHEIHPARIAGHFPYQDLRVRLACHGKGVLFEVQSVIDKHDTRGVLRMVFPAAPWERRLYISPRIDRATAAVVSNFVTESLGTYAWAGRQ
ncbi:MAG TPA: LysR family transcriptional regulator [Steroidobacteraceae bacterium]|nr:LysR family transcriptional regulator [Steroidobacteraceae bacterium]